MSRNRLTVKVKVIQDDDIDVGGIETLATGVVKVRQNGGCHVGGYHSNHGIFL